MEVTLMTEGYQFVNLIYEDGSPATDLKGKFVEITE